MYGTVSYLRVFCERSKITVCKNQRYIRSKTDIKRSNSAHDCIHVLDVERVYAHSTVTYVHFAKDKRKRRLCVPKIITQCIYFSSRCAVAFSTLTTSTYLILNMDAKADSNTVSFCESMHWKKRRGVCCYPSASQQTHRSVRGRRRRRVESSAIKSEHRHIHDRANSDRSVV